MNIETARSAKAAAGHAIGPSSGNRGVIAECLAGVVASFVTLAYCLSFSALLFGGDLSAGLPMALWGFTIGAGLVTIMTGFATTLPPLLAGPRNPAVAVMSVLAATVAAAAAAKGLSHAEAARHVLIGLAAASVLTGALTWALGHFGLGQIVRFVPYPVVAGFLAASGVLLILGGIRVAAGISDATDIASLGQGSTPLRLALAAAFLGLVMMLKHTGLGARALPAVIIISALLLDLVLYLAGVDQRSGWHLDAGAGAVAWSPLASLGTVDWSVLRPAVVEIASIAGVSTAALLLDVSSLEVQRRTEADIDAEFMANGAANLAVSMIGGLSVGPALNTSRLVDDLGGRGRLAGIAAGAFVVGILALGVEFSHLVPRPILGGLLLFMGTGVLMESLKVPGTRSWLEFALTLAIMAAIIGLGYLTGLVLGLIGACLLFAARYSRIDVVRRHLTRREISAPIERPHEVAHLLKTEGNRIHVFWLSGYLFFGSSDAVAGKIRRAVDQAAQGEKQWIVLDVAAVTGLDTAAVLSLQKLANWARRANAILIFAAASPSMTAELRAAGLVTGVDGVSSFASRNDALAWCEAELVGERAENGGSNAAFTDWIAREIGIDHATRLIETYLRRRVLVAGENICLQGAPSDTIELVAEGSVAVMVARTGAENVKVRTMTRATLVGEMGFFRGLPRAASVIAEGPATVFVMSRESFTRMQTNDPDLSVAFLEFVIRTLADRVAAANVEITALL